MPSEEEFEELKGRIVELESQVSKGGDVRRVADDISDEELQTFVKVRDVIAFTDWGEFCGINDCFKCIIVQPCISHCISQCVQRCFTPCIFECSCGPCLMGGGQGGVGRFGNLGT